MNIEYVSVSEIECFKWYSLLFDPLATKPIGCITASSRPIKTMTINYELQISTKASGVFDSRF